MPTYIVLLGPPGAGKGTQAQIVSERLHLPHISSGEIFREHLKDQTELGQHAKEYMDRGELVPDDVTIAMIRERLSRPDCEQGALMDGFPRTAAQAEAFSEILASFGGQVDCVPYISVPEQELIDRLSGRLTCRAEGHVFHSKFNPPERESVCDFDGSELYQREDDKVETVTRRIHVYMEQTAPLIAYYRERDVLVEVDGNQSIEGVTQGLMKELVQFV